MKPGDLVVVKHKYKTYGFINLISYDKKTNKEMMVTDEVAIILSIKRYPLLLLLTLRGSYGFAGVIFFEKFKQ